MKTISTAFLATSLLLTACDDPTVKQWFDPDRTFASLPQPEIKGINATEEQLAIEATQKGDFKRASQFYEQLVGSKKGSPEEVLRYKLGLAESARRLGENDRALAMFSQLTKENPDNLDAHEGRALTLTATGKTTDAGREFSDILAKDPKRWRTLNALGILFTSKNMIPEAMAYYTEALKYSPDNVAVLNNVGLAQAIDRQYAAAIEALGQASRLSKSPAQRQQVDLNLAMVYGASGDLDTASDVAGKYLSGPALDNNLGLYAHLSKNDALAKTYLNMALSQSPVYYERAWENLDVVNDSDSGTTGSGASNAPEAQIKKR
ncbi:MAG: tetratricopeptide repeat protein [Rickettsiales bacterium]